MTITLLDVSNTSVVTFLDHAVKTNQIATHVNSANTSVTAALATKASNTYVNAQLATKSSNGHTHTYSSLTSKPTTLSGFGITSLDLGTLPNTFTANSASLRIKSSSTANTIVTPSTVAVRSATSNTSMNSFGLTLANTSVSYTLNKPSAAQVAAGNYFSGSNGTWQQITISYANTVNVFTGSSTTTSVTPQSAGALWKMGSNIASAGTITVPDDGSKFHVTGTTTITDIDFTTTTSGREVELIFDGALTLTHNATTLILPGGANITTAAGDSATFISEGGDNVRCIKYQKADGTPLIGRVLLSTHNTSSGTTWSTTNIASIYRHIEVEWEGVSLSGAGNYRIAVSNNNGSSYGTAQAFTNVKGTSESCSGTMTIYGIQVPRNNGYGIHCQPYCVNISDNSVLTTLLFLLAGSATPNPINAIQFSASAGAGDAGTIRVYGVM